MERESSDIQSAYLIDLATRFQNVVSLSLDAKYGSNDIFDNDENEVLRLATAVMSLNLVFADELARWGQEHSFPTCTEMPDGESAQEQLPPALDWESTDEKGGASLQPIQVRKIEEADIEDILHSQETLSESSGNSIALWLKKEYETSMGFAIGTFNSSILATTMKIQSRKWASLARGYISDIIAITHRFIV